MARRKEQPEPRPERAPGGLLHAADFLFALGDGAVFFGRRAEMKARALQFLIDEIFRIAHLGKETELMKRNDHRRGKGKAETDQRRHAPIRGPGKIELERAKSAGDRKCETIHQLPPSAQV